MKIIEIEIVILLLNGEFIQPIIIAINWNAPDRFFIEPAGILQNQIDFKSETISHILFTASNLFQTVRGNKL